MPIAVTVYSRPSASTFAGATSFIPSFPYETVEKPTSAPCGATVKVNWADPLAGRA